MNIIHKKQLRIAAPLWKTVWRFLKKLRIELPYDLFIPPLSINLKNTETLIQKDICTHMFIAALFILAKIWKQPKCSSIDESIKRMWYIYIYIYIYISIYLYIQWNITEP